MRWPVTLWCDRAAAPRVHAPLSGAHAPNAPLREEAQALKGKTVAILGGAMCAQYSAMKAKQCLPLPAGTRASEGASCFVNPLASQGMVETMRREGHTALVHTAAASNLGQMLNKICIADGVGLVNIVRSQEQAKLLKALGLTKHVCDSSATTFLEDLTEALVATGATLAFDAIGGGKLAGQILDCMKPRSTARPRSTAAMAPAPTSTSISMAAWTPARPRSIATSAWPGVSAAGCSRPSCRRSDSRPRKAARARGRGIEDHLRQPLHQGAFALRGALGR